MDYINTIIFAAKTVKVPSALLLAICMHESKLNNHVNQFDGGSPSYGICQIKEDTARDMGFKGKTEKLMEPYTNAYYAAKYLKYQLQRYDNDFCRATAAYNAGTFNKSQVMPGYPRNLKYVRNVQKHLDHKLKNKLSCSPRNDLAQTKGSAR